MFNKETLIWSLGTFTAGYFIGSYIIRAKHKNNDVAFNSALQILGDGDTIVYNETGLCNENITTFSELSLLLGSPTASQDFNATLEYRFYEATENYPDLKNNRTFMARYLTKDVYEDLYQRKTSYGFTIDSCIQIAIDRPLKENAGLVAGDEECYDVFANIFRPVIDDRHRCFRRGPIKHKGDISGDGLIAKSFDEKYITSTHFLAIRCLRGFRFPPSCSRAERKHAENLMKVALESLTGEFAGTYIHISDLDPTQFRRLRLPDALKHVVYRADSQTSHTCGSARDWPSGRGIFHSKLYTLFAHTNRENHLEVMYTDCNSLDLIKDFKRFTNAIKELEENLKESGIEFAFHSDYGYLTTIPSGIGTALRVGVRLKLPNLVQDRRFKTILKSLRLHHNEILREDKRKVGVVDVHNADRLGLTETDIVRHVNESVHVLIDMEKRLENKQSMSDLI